MNRLKKDGNVNESDLKAHEESKHHLEEQIRQHKEAATKSREFYKTCQDKCKTSWSYIVRLSNKSPLTAAEREELDSLKHCFTLTISADYQQSKLIPSWGKIEQPSSTYYLQKVSHDVFGIVDHREEKGTIHMFDERIGPKNDDHTISLLMRYWETVSCAHRWIQRLAIFLDNATSTNKNKIFVCMGYGVGKQRSNQSCPHQLHDSWTYEVRTRSPFRHNRECLQGSRCLYNR